MNARLLAFRTLYKIIRDQDKPNKTGLSLLFSVLIYFSTEFIYKIADELQVEEIGVYEINGLRFLYTIYGGQEYIAFRGTEYKLWSNMKRVLNFIPKRTFTGHKAHRGFVMAFEDCDTIVSNLIKDRRRVIFTGHSLGGALALLGADQYGSTAVAFASPKVFFNRKKDMTVNYLGYKVIGDPIVHLPGNFFFMNWTRALPEFWFASKKKRSWNPLTHHSAGSYVDTLLDEFYDNERKAEEG